MSKLKKILFITISLLLVNCSSFQGGNSINVSTDLDNRGWKSGYSNFSKQGNIIEYTLPNESLSNWSELFTIQSYPLLINMTSDSYSKNFKNIINGMKDTYLESVYDSTNDNMIYWYTPNPSLRAETTLTRVVNAYETLYVFQYSTKEVPISQANKEKWIDILKNIKIGKTHQY